MNRAPIDSVTNHALLTHVRAALATVIILVAGMSQLHVARAQHAPAEAAPDRASALSTVRNPFVAKAAVDQLPAPVATRAEPATADAPLADLRLPDVSTLDAFADAPPVPDELVPDEPVADAPFDSLPADESTAEPSSGDAALPFELPGGIGGPEDWFSPEGISSAVQILLLMAVVSLAPALLLMTTCFVRIVVVLGLLRQALGTQHLPPNQVMTSIALFMTLLIMMPVWSRVYDDAIKPYAAQDITLEEAWDAGVEPVRQFMSAQIDRTGNRNDVWLFYKYLPEPAQSPSSYDDVPLSVLLPAFMLSELKTAFLIGFQIYLPFLVLDLVVASVTISMGMLMLPPMLISLPFKLLLFVLVDGWHLVVGMLLESFQTFS